jgi:hypothetical protein
VGYSVRRNQTARPLLFKMRSDADHLTGVPGLSPAVLLSKNGGPFAAPAGAVAEVGGTGNGHGYYQVAPNAADANTAGPLVLRATAAGCDESDVTFEVVNYDPDDGAGLGLSGVPAVLTAGGLDNIPMTAPPGPATTFRGAMVQMWRRFFRKAVRDARTIKTYADDGGTVLTTQSYTAVGSTEVVGDAA